MNNKYSGPGEKLTSNISKFCSRGWRRLFLLLNYFLKPILKIIPQKWTVTEDFKDWICALAEQICTIKTSHRSQIILKKFLHNTTFLFQLPYIAGHSLYHIFHQCESSLFIWSHINKFLKNVGNKFELLKWSHIYIFLNNLALLYHFRSG